MQTERSAFMALNTYPDVVPDEAVQSAVRYAAGIGRPLRVSVYAVTIPPMRSPLGGLVLDVTSMVRAAEDRSREEARRLEDLVRSAAGPAGRVEVVQFEAHVGGAAEAAAREARLHELAILPWSGKSESVQDISQAVVFGSGRPVIVVPPGAAAGMPTHVAVAWDGGRAAARALGDALSLLPPDSAVSILTIVDEKPGTSEGLGKPLAEALAASGRTATARDIAPGGRAVHAALQDAAAEAGASMLVMGGFGHSRLRDFVLGGATKGILHDLRLPTLMSH